MLRAVQDVGIARISQQTCWQRLLEIVFVHFLRSRYHYEACHSSEPKRQRCVLVASANVRSTPFFAHEIIDGENNKSISGAFSTHAQVE